MRTTHTPARTPRAGTIVPVMALCVTGLFGFVALAVDLGVLAVTRTECQNAADAAALAGARQLNNATTSTNNNSTAADTQARSTVKANNQLNTPFTDGNISAVDIGTYTYDTTNQKFVTSFTGTKSASDSWTAVRVTLTANQPMFFAKIFGIQSMPTGASAVAVHRPRDIAVVLDFSTSMMFGSTSGWGNMWDGQTTRGMMNPDDNWPKFSHYSRYQAYSTSVDIPATSATTVTGAASPSGRPNPMQRTAAYYSIGYIFSPNNHTVESDGGPPMMFDFRFNPANIATPGTAAPAVANMWNAFHRWFQATPTDTPDTSLSIVDQGNPYKYATFKPTVLTTTDQGTWKKRTYDWTGYDPFDTTNAKGPTPAPDFFDTQADDATTSVKYTGDRFPRKKGVVRTTPTSWDYANTDGAAVNLIEYLNWATAYNYYPPSRTATSSGSGTTSRTGLNLSPNSNDYATNWSTFRDAAWERYGYDLDVADYVTNRGATWDPRWDWDIDAAAWQHYRTVGTSPSTTFRPKRKAAADQFKGYSMGPGYWGKSFAVWPPDPRWGGDILGSLLGGGIQPQSPNGTGVKDTNGNWICDWRKRFFLKSTGAQFGSSDNVNSTLFQSTASGMLKTSGFQINYPAVLAWIKSGPQTLPPNLRAGRILYYDCIPSTVASASSDLNQAFWKGYIDFVLGQGSFAPTVEMAGVEDKVWPEGGAMSVGGTTTGYTHGLTAVVPTTDPAAYLNYYDNPCRTRAHMWFGPQTMLMYLYSRDNGSFWGAGTLRETQTWQLKAAVNSGLEDIRVNHPNDWCGMSYFANFNFSTPRAPMGQDWSLLKNALFYPNSLITGTTPLINTITNEVRPYNTSLSNTLVGNIPNADGGTDPNTGLALAYNLLSSSTSLSSTTYPTKGRRGAAKIVIFETDGVPNGTPNWSMTGTGYNTYYQNSGSSATWPGETRTVNGTSIALNNTYLNASATTPANAALQVIKQICSQESSTSQGGFATANTPVRVYPIGFGDIFTGYDGANYSSLSTTQAQDAVKFLTRAGQLGNTVTWSSSAILPSGNIITGDYSTRINNLKSTLQTIMQSGVQVTLIQ